MNNYTPEDKWPEPTAITHEKQGIHDLNHPPPGNYVNKPLGFRDKKPEQVFIFQFRPNFGRLGKLTFDETLGMFFSHVGFFMSFRDWDRSCGENKMDWSDFDLWKRRWFLWMEETYKTACF